MSDWETVKGPDDEWETVAKPLQPTARGTMRNVLGEAMRGMTQGGPPAALVRSLMAGVPPLMDAENEAITTGAYNAGGAVTDFASKSGAPPTLAGGLGYATNVAVQAAPAFLGGLISEPIEAPVKGLSRKLMGSALKPDLRSRMTGKADRAINTMLDEGINATQGGVDKMRGMVDDLNKQVGTIIAGSSKTIDKNKTANYLQDVIKKFENRPNALEAQADVEKAWMTFVNHPKISGQTKIPIQTAQSLKQGYQRSVGDKGYGELKTAATESEKAIARGLREEITAAEPTVGPLNAREAGLINAIKIASRRAGMEQNNNPLGLALLAHKPGAFIAMLADRWGLAKSVVARILYSEAKTIPVSAGRIGGLAYQQHQQAQRGH